MWCRNLIYTTLFKIKLAIGGGIFLFVIVLTAVIIVDSVHTIEEGNVGIYFVQGALGEIFL